MNKQLFQKQSDKQKYQVKGMLLTDFAKWYDLQGPFQPK